MKFRNWFLSFAVLAGLAATAAEAVPEPEKTPAAEAGASAPALELPPRIGLFMKSSDPDDGTHGTVGVSLTGVPAGQYFGGLQLGFFGENFEFHNSYGIWAGWYGEMQRQKGLQFAFTNVAWKYATGQFALGGNFAELCECRRRGWSTARRSWPERSWPVSETWPERRTGFSWPRC